MALGMIPAPVSDSPQALAQLHQQLQLQPNSVALLDLGSLPAGFKHLLDLTQKFPAALRQRVILFRHEQGPVWPSDQAWASDLGFAGLFSEIDTAAMLTENAALPRLLAKLAHCPPLETQKLGQFFAAMLAQANPMSRRGLIRTQCKRDAESLAQVMSSGVRSVDRSYRFSRYPACFVGTDAVQWLREQYLCSTDIAVQLGQALHNLGLIHHVTHEHGFENAEFFYRLDATANTARAHLGHLLKAMRGDGGLEIADRLYLGKTYRQCLVGQDAVSWLSKKHRLPRHEAENLLNRLLSYGLIEHVTKAHRVKDANLFFRLL